MRKWRGVLGGTAIGLCIAAAVVAAVLADGRSSTESKSNDGGAWLLYRGKSAIGHVNRVVGEVSSAVGPFSGEFEVDQSDGVVVVNNRGEGEAILVDTKLGQAGAPLRLGLATDVHAAPDAVVLVDRDEQAVWRFSREEFGTIGALADSEPLIQATSPIVTAVGLDGLVAAADGGGGLLHRAVPDGAVASVEVPPIAGTTVSAVTLVGDTTVIAYAADDTSPTELALVDGGGDVRTVALDAVVSQLQQPSPGASAVTLITTAGAVLDVDLRSGAVTERDQLPGSDFVAPIVHDGCVWTISLTPSPEFHYCGRHEPLANTGARLTLRLVNGWVWVNDVDQGSIWFVQENDLQLRQITDWDAALNQTEDADQPREASGDEETVVTPDADVQDEVDPLDTDDVNEPPVAVDDTAATRRGRTVIVPVLANDTDPDHDPLTVQSLTGLDSAGFVGPGARVTITANGGAVQVEPPEDFVGDLAFGYVMSDGRGGSDDGAVTVTVNQADQATNRPPVTVADTATVRAGRSVRLNVLNNDSDPDGDVLVLTGVAGSDGAVNFAPDGEVAYSPDVTSTEGTIELTYTIADDFGAEASGVVRVLVRSADSNQPPEARNDIGRTAVGRPVIVDVLGNDTDPDGDALVAQSLRQVDNPVTTAQLSPDGRFLFQPEAPGTYRFVYTVSDGPEVDEAQVRVDVDPSAENRPPVAVTDRVALAIGERRLVRVLDNDGDPDGDVIGIVEWVEVPGLEIDEVPGIGFLITATPTAEPRSTVRYWISDGRSDPVRGDVVVSALARQPVDYAPVAVGDTVDVRAGTTAYLPVLLNDFDPEGAVLRLVGPVAEIPEGTIRLSADRQTLLLRTGPTQRTGFRFSYDVEDPGGNRASAVVSVRIVDPGLPNRAPVAGPDVARTSAGDPVQIPVLINDLDPDGDAINVESIAQQPANGTLELQPGGVIIYTPAAGFSGTDSFTYTLVDGYLAPAGVEDPNAPGRALGRVFVGVMAQGTANRPPSAVDDDDLPPIALGGPAVQVPVLLNDTDPDGDRLRVTEVSVAAVGRAFVSTDGNSVTYEPPATGAPREVSFAYSVADGRGGVDTATVTLDLRASIDPIPPEAVDDRLGPARAGTTITSDLRVNDLDRDGDPAALVVVPVDPAITVNADGTVTIVAPPRTADLAYHVRDAQGLQSEIAYVTLLVASNRAPEIDPIAVETDFGTPVTVDIGAAVTDPDGDPLVVTLGRQSTGGAAVVQGQPADGELVVTFTPDADFSGVAGFDFTVDDRFGHTVSGRASVTVRPPANRPPEAAPIAIVAQAGIPAVVRLPDSVTDPDPDGAQQHVFSITGPDAGVVDLEGPNAAGEVWIRSDVTEGGGRDSFEYTVVDGEHTVTNTVTVELEVPDFPPPTLGDDRGRTLQGQTSAPIDLLANDVDNSPAGLVGDGLLVTEVGVSEHGEVRLTGSSVVFQPDPDFFGTTSFTYTVQDGRRSSEASSTGLVTIDVIGRPAIPQPPVIESVGNGYLVLSWSSPQGDAARAPVTGYSLRYVANDGSTSTTTFDGPTTGYRWQGLTNGVRYCFAVAAVNEAGMGEYSPSVGTAECATPDVRPEPPAAPAVAFGDGQLIVTWTPPLNQGTPIVNYQLRISGGRQEVSAELGTSTSFTWTGLSNGTDYTFEVRAQNSAADNGGWSDWSSLSAAEHPLTVPDAPAQPQAQRGDRQVVVTWSAPYDGGDAISRYQVRSSLSPAWVDVTPQGATNSHTWQNIPNGTDVSFQVRAVNRDPASTTPGNISASSPVVRTCSVPDAPPQPAVVRGDTQVTVSWTRPPDQGCAITGYRITSSAGATQTAPAASTQMAFTGLTNGTSYTFQVAAINEVVTQDGRPPSFSPASAAVVPAGPPGVSNVTGASNVGVRTVRVDWTAANPNGSAVLGYEISVNGGAWQSVGNVLTVTRAEASNGATYSYRIRAVNDVGPGAAGAQASVTTWNVPGVPNVTVNGGNQQVSASWTAPAANGTPLTAHQAMLTTGGCTGGGTVRDNAGSPETFGGLAQSTSYRVCVRYQNAVGWGDWGSAVATTDPPPAPSVNAFWGGSAQGQPGCSSPLCKYLNATGSNFNPGQSYQVVCQENPTGTWQTYSGTYTRVADGNGVVSFANVCYFGFNTHSARVVIGGVPSNAISA